MDTTIMQMTEEHRALLALLGAALFERKVEIPPDLNWNELVEEAREQAVLPLVMRAAGSRIPAEILPGLQAQFDSLVFHNMSLEWEHVALHQFLEQGGIPYVIMKGSASAAYYPDPMLRMMGDVDVLVGEEHLARVTEILQKEGFKIEDVSAIDTSFYRRDPGQEPVEIEVHRRPNGIPATPAGELIGAYLADSVSTAVLRETENGSYMVPDRFHHGLMLLLHTANHMINTGIGLRHLCDWAVFVDQFTPDAFCELFREKLESVGLWKFTGILTALCGEMLGGREQPWAREVCGKKLLKSLCEDIFAGGNFGQKDSQRINQAKLYTNKGKATVNDTGIVKQLALTLNEKARIAMPLTRKSPLLLPAGWIYVSARHLWRMGKGRRPSIRLSKTIDGAKQRRDIYRQLHLFETE